MFKNSLNHVVLYMPRAIIDQHFKEFLQKNTAALDSAGSHANLKRVSLE